MTGNPHEVELVVSSIVFNVYVQLANEPGGGNSFGALQYE